MDVLDRSCFGNMPEQGACGSISCSRWGGREGRSRAPLETQAVWLERLLATVSRTITWGCRAKAIGKPCHLAFRTISRQPHKQQQADIFLGMVRMTDHPGSAFAGGAGAHAGGPRGRSCRDSLRRRAAQQQRRGRCRRGPGRRGVGQRGLRPGAGPARPAAGVQALLVPPGSGLPSYTAHFAERHATLLLRRHLSGLSPPLSQPRFWGVEADLSHLCRSQYNVPRMEFSLRYSSKRALSRLQICWCALATSTYHSGHSRELRVASAGNFVSSSVWSSQRGCAMQGAGAPAPRVTLRYSSAAIPQVTLREFCGCVLRCSAKAQACGMGGPRTHPRYPE